jgi:integrase
MAIGYDEYTESNKTNKKLITSLKATKDYKRYLYQPRINGVLRRKLFNYSALNLSKTDLITKANNEALKFKAEEESNSTSAFDKKTKFDAVATEYFKHSDATDWTEMKRRQYELYLKPHIGSKALSTITRLELDQIKTFMKSNGFGRQNENGCSARTIHKLFMQVLAPILKYGLDTGATDKIPQFPKIEKEHNKKTVKNATDKYVSIYKSIMHLYEADPFYRSLFGFALVGRRWNEIASLEWDDIDFKNHIYTIKAESNKVNEDQEYDLPIFIYESLKELGEEQGLIFKSPKTGAKLHSPKRQLERIRIASGVEELTMHLFRHLYVSALSKAGIHSSMLSDALGHKDSRTLDMHYRTADRLEASKRANKLIGSLE